MLRRSIVACLLFLVASSGCGGCGDPEPGTNCEPGEVENPITGACAPSRSVEFPDQGGTGDGDAGGEVDMWHNPYLDMAADVSEADRCKAGLDSDRDGLDNECECTLGTDPARADSDDDGKADGSEDANGNCVYDLGRETDPRRADTDADGLSDGDEVRAGTDGLDNDSDDDGIEDGAEVNSGCMNPLSDDTDGDTLPDGVEDTNLDGMLGTCVDRVYSPECAGNESDPCRADTDGDGTDDNEEAQFLGCTPADTANLVDPQLLESAPGNYKVALELGVSASAVTGLDAHAISDGPNGYAGFVTALPAPGGVSSAEALAAHVYTAIAGQYPAATQRATGRRIQTHDQFPALVGAVAQLPAGLRADQVRDSLLARLSGVGSVSHNATGNFSASAGGDPMLVVYEVILRGGGKYVISLAAVAQSDYEDPNGAAGFLVDDLTGGTAIAKAGEGLESECVSYRNDARAKVDFIWILDGSGSMDEENEQVAAFATEFAAILANSNLDWRIAVTNGTCFDISADAGIRQDVKNLFAPAGNTGPCPGAPPIGNFTPPPIHNGKLCNNAFTTDAQIFRGCIDTVRQGLLQTEHTMTIGTAAIDRATPRSDTDPSKIRTDAAVVVISVTDEFDDFVQGKLRWRDAGAASDPPNDPTLDPGYDQTAVDNAIRPFVDYYLRPDVAATLFGIYWIPGTTCASASEASAGIHTAVSQTGGTAGSVCQADLSATLQQIASASAGIASGLRLRGVPVAPSIETKVGQVNTGNIVDLTRSRANGWDYDSTVNRVTFQGPNPPQTGDRVVIAYRRWEGSIRQCVEDIDCPQEQKYRCVSGLCL